MLLHRLGPDAGHVSDGPVGQFQDHGDFWKQLKMWDSPIGHRPTMTGDGFKMFQSHVMVIIWSYWGWFVAGLTTLFGNDVAKLCCQIMLPFTTMENAGFLWKFQTAEKRAKLTTLPWPFPPFAVTIRVTIAEESKALSDGIEFHLLLASIPLHNLWGPAIDVVYPAW